MAVWMEIAKARSQGVRGATGLALSLNPSRPRPTSVT